jgi:predicted dehydrogenase
MNSGKTYQAAVIGLGFIGAGDQVSGDALGQQVANLDGTHAGALSNHPRVKLVAGSSRDLGRRERFAQRYPGVNTFEHWQDLLAAGPIDILSVATYTPQHAPMVIEAARRGVRAIYCEKPIASSPAEGDAMIAACRASGSLLVINHNRRFHPAIRALAARVAAGELGDLTSMTLAWSSGRLGNIGTHVFDAAMMVSGRKITAVSGTLDPAGKPDCRGPEFRDPGGWGVLRFEGGLHATVDGGDYSRLPITITFNGTLGRAAIGRLKIDLDFWDGRHESIDMPRGGRSCMDQAVSEIVDHLDGRATLACDPADSVLTLEAIAAFALSHERGGAFVELPLRGEDRARVVRSG